MKKSFVIEKPNYDVQLGFMLKEDPQNRWGCDEFRGQSYTYFDTQEQAEHHIERAFIAGNMQDIRIIAVYHNEKKY